MCHRVRRVPDLLWDARCLDWHSYVVDCLVQRFGILLHQWRQWCLRNCSRMVHMFHKLLSELFCRGLTAHTTQVCQQTCPKTWTSYFVNEDIQHLCSSCIIYDLRFSRRWLWRMVSSGMLRRVALVRTDVSEELSASFIRVTTVFLRSVRRLLVTASVVPSSPILVTQKTPFFSCIICLSRAVSVWTTHNLYRFRRRPFRRIHWAFICGRFWAAYESLSNTIPIISNLVGRPVDFLLFYCPRRQVVSHHTVV
jgi:hypothetical protein